MHTTNILSQVREKACFFRYIQPKELKISSDLTVLAVAQSPNEMPQTSAPAASIAPTSVETTTSAKMILNPIFISKAKGALLGLALGDAYGGPFEFMDRDKIEKMFEESPEELNHLQQGGQHRLNKGEFTDDTSMALCLGDSLLEKGQHDAKDQLDKYLSWFTQGSNIPRKVDKAFDIGDSTRRRLEQYAKDRHKANAGNIFSSTNPMAGGNGSLMRFAPVGIFYATTKGHSLEDAYHYAVQSSKTTHGSPVAGECCKILSFILNQCFENKVTSKQKIIENLFRAFPEKQYKINWILKDMRLLHKTFKDLHNPSRPHYQRSGYCIESLRGALWCFATTDNFIDGAKEAVKLGFDTDTVAAIYGQIAGAYYGEEGLPKEWLSNLKWDEHIRNMACQLAIHK